MVKHASFAVTADGEIDLAAGARQITVAHPELDAQAIQRVAEGLSADNLAFGLELAALLADLQMDQPSVIAGLAYRELRTARADLAALRSLIGVEATELVAAVHRMATTSLLEISNSNLHDSEQESQVENVKRMLVAMIDDPRVAVVKLAERVIAMRFAKDYPVARRLRIANEALSIFAPLAGRLGIGQLKWELEDFALRYSEEQRYKAIAQQLKAKREDREGQVKEIENRLRALIEGHGIQGSVYGRAKHIYSILRKMEVKNVPFEQVYDVRAFRIIVGSVAECYAVLGLIHTTWPYLPSEFDDYIANPKENGYQSIHTALTLEDEQMMEIQIRTDAMHAEAELGLCAHWNYKGEDDDSESYRLKMDWLRQVIEWHEELEGTERLSALLQQSTSSERIYVSTPQGHVVDLPQGATLLDFAYRVHTAVGHSCIGGSVNGEPRSVYHTLETSQQVVVETDTTAEPRRDWLEKGFGYVRTDRARAKLVSYFRALDSAQKVSLGSSMLGEALFLLGVEPSAETWPAVIEYLAMADQDQLLTHLGSGELGLFEVVDAFIMRSSAQQQLGFPGLEGDNGRQVVRMYLRAANRDGLLRELTEVVASLGLPLSETSGRLTAGGDEAVLDFETHVQHWQETLKLQSRLRHIGGVVQIGPWSRDPIKN